MASKKRATKVDRISKLPDEVLCHILSFLPTEEVVATSVLSKRWMPLWLSVPTLDFVHSRYVYSNKSKSDFDFINFVYAAILSRDLNQPIKNFKLVVGEECPYSDVKLRLNAAIQRQVENLEIQFLEPQVPCCILSCKTLVFFKLSDVKFDGFSCVDLPSLKTLHLNNVEFVEPQYLMKLLYGCPVLEDLKIYDIYFEDESSFEGKVKSFPKLVRAEVFMYGDFHIPVKAFRNVQHLLLNQCHGDIPVFPNLIYMELHSFYWSLVLDMLNHCPKLQTVVFYLVDREDEVWPYPCFVPECFSSHHRKCFLKDFTGVECQKRFARYVMQNSASLCTMKICTAPNHRRTLEILTELTSYPRSSAVCELLFK
ncbi:F-box/FBD/LRR-repeat protein At4g26340-like [Lotus japonicus]|uniref:F-box/FBD/LRR-repeat protein At4g26340-like n=1 Tax=Lotus japonicus TaxID=34305 RepID=UPI00258946EB|nr:F-box/FBD/LRR-repeat protein At4g26340-like [Lotus japonicus]